SLVHLPSTFTEKAKIQPGCAASAGNNFVISGRGGLPQSPNDLFDGNAIFIELIDSVFTQTSASNSNIYQNRNSIKIDNQKNNIIEATEWIKDTDGNVIFVAKVPQPTSQNPGVSSASCQNFSTLSE
ncbi:MAG: filamentous hemagglutinin, partial [Cyanobacteria bacterium P01_D01_bin.116]